MKKFLIIGGLLLVPSLAFAQLGNVEDIIVSIGRIIGILIPIVAALALLYFFWGLAKFILNSGDEEARAAARGQMIWGIVALFVIVAVWGLVGFLVDAIGIDTPETQEIPGVDLDTNTQR